MRPCYSNVTGDMIEAYSQMREREPEYFIEWNFGSWHFTVKRFLTKPKYRDEDYKSWKCVVVRYYN